VGLEGRTAHRPSELSGGEQQRVAIARALVNRPRILLADEPTGNLDSRTSREIVTVLAELNRDHGLTVIMVTHEESLAREFASRSVRLSDGRVQAEERWR
jgi:putative ABC transport system ATP-binding protein